MKRILTTLLIFCFVLCLLPVSAFAATGTYDLDELGMSIELPSDHVVFTRDIEANDPNLSAYGLTKDGLSSLMQERSIYLNAWDEDINYEIIVTMLDSPFEDYNQFSDTSLSAFVSALDTEYAGLGITMIRSEFYQHSQAKFAKIYISQPNNGETAYGLQYHTVYDGKAINITLQSYSGKIDSSKEAILKKIVDTVHFDTEPQFNPLPAKTEAFTYTDPTSGMVFTVPANWVEERNQREYDKGVRINFKQSYTQFMGVLHDEYFGTPAVVALPSPDSSDKQEETPVVTTKASQKKSKQRYCKLCGQPIDNTTKKCTGCGKQYFKARFKPLYALLVILLLVGGYVGANYFCAVSAMNDEEFIKSKQFFDNLFVSETLFPTKYAYVEAGVLMEEGKYVESLNAFKKVDGVPIPAEITDSLKSKIYSAGQSAYKAGKMTEAKKNFNAISGYKKSDDYLLLIRCKNSAPGRVDYLLLLNLLGFEDADEVIMTHQSTAIKFLTGRWESGSYYYFEIEDGEDNYSTYNLPHKDVDGYYSIEDGIYSVETTKYFKFSVIDEDTISVYCYKDGSTHKLYRQ